MHSELRAQLAFRLTGLRAESAQATGLGTIVPALAARHRDLAALRYDYPLVLLTVPRGDDFAVPLGALVDRALAADPAREPLRPTLLRLERAVRAMAAEGAAGTLQRMWEAAATRLAAGAEPAAARKLAGAARCLTADGVVLDCDGDLPRHFVSAAWKIVQQRKSIRFHEEADRLTLRLGEILAADDARSTEALSPERLAEGVGSLHREAFDFQAMTRVLSRSQPQRPLPHARRRRIRMHLAALESQRFFADDAGHGFAFDRCGAALKAARARQARLRTLARVLAMASLEADCQYDESRHDPIFRQLRDSPLTREELARFPDYLVCLRQADLDGAGLAELVELLTCGLPVKVLVQFDDILEQSAASDGLAAIAAKANAVAALAMGLDDVFVVQSASSHLPRMQADVLRALAYPGPALVSVFSGSHAGSSLPPYLAAAAAVESRAFPALVWNPAGATGHERLSLAANPQPGRDWPAHPFDYEDASHQRVTEEMHLTAADFLVADERFARHFLELPKEGATPVALADWLENPAVDDESCPVTAVVDGADMLRRLIADEAVVDLSRRAREHWRGLQQRAQKPATVVIAAPTTAAQADVAPVAEGPAPAAPAPAEPAKAASSDEAYIETPRCTSCDECTHLNNRMFAYDANKQAFIKDLAAGTYRELVEAAESCQVSIIHPGRPRNPDEPDLEELLERAKPFM